MVGRREKEYYMMPDPLSLATGGDSLYESMLIGLFGHIRRSLALASFAISSAIAIGSDPATKLHPKICSTSPKSSSSIAFNDFTGRVLILQYPPPLG